MRELAAVAMHGVLELPDDWPQARAAHTGVHTGERGSLIVEDLLTAIAYCSIISYCQKSQINCVFENLIAA